MPPGTAGDEGVVGLLKSLADGDLSTSSSEPILKPKPLAPKKFKDLNSRGESVWLYHLTLSLRGKQITDKGASALAAGLKEHRYSKAFLRGSLE